MPSPAVLSEAALSAAAFSEAAFSAAAFSETALSEAALSEAALSAAAFSAFSCAAFCFAALSAATSSAERFRPRRSSSGTFFLGGSGGPTRLVSPPGVAPAGGVWASDDAEAADAAVWPDPAE